MTQTPKQPRGGPGSLFVFDSYNFIFRAYHALPLLTAPDGRPVHAVHGFVRMIQAVRRDFEPERVLAVFDAGGDGRRREIYPEYKAHRPPAPEDLVPQFALVREATEALGIPIAQDTRFEADDLIASYTVAAHARGLRVVIVSSDKDLMQLCQLPDEGDEGSVLLLDTMKNRTVGPAEVEAKFGVGPDRLGDLLALTGDSSDNVPGVPGIGPKTAAELLGEFGDLEGVLAAAGSIKQKKRRERLIEHAEDARISRRLVALNDDVDLPVPLEDLVDRGARADRLAAFFGPLGFKQVLAEAGVKRAATEVASKGKSAEDPQSLELSPVPFEASPDRYRTLLRDGDDELDAWVAELDDAREVGVYVAAETGEGTSARVVGIALAPQGGRPTYVPFAHRQADLVAGPQIEAGRVVASLRDWLQASAPTKIVHDHKQAGHALASLGIALAGVRDDPMLASYTMDPARASHDLEGLAQDVLEHGLAPEATLLGKGRKAVTLGDVDPARAGPWMCERVEATLAIGRALADQVGRMPAEVGKLLATIEMPLAGVLGRLEARGILLDVDVLHAQSVALGSTITQIRERVEQEVGHPVNLDSPVQLRQLLFEERGLPPVRKTKTGFSTDAKVLEELRDLDPIIREILEYRSVVKLKNTYLDALPKLVDPSTGRLHTSFNQAVASTGRLSSSDPNLQNIPIRTPEGRRIREAFVAPKGRILVALDYSQIELRVLAHLSGDPNLTSAFRDGVDVHRRTAAEVFDVDEAEVDGEQRRIAKAVNFGVVYGQTAFGLAQQLGIPRGKANLYINAYFKKIPGVKRYMEALVEIAKRRGYAETILGRRRRIPELARKGAAQAHGARMARNTPIQGSAADILKLAMIAVDRELEAIDWAKMLLTVHDELIFECDAGRVDELIGICRPLMENAVELDVPLQVDAGAGETWAECKG